jgi:hypothetical protein
MKTFSWKKVFWIGVVCAVVLRLGLFAYFALALPSGFFVDDSYGYVQIADNILNGDGFSRDTQEPFLPESFRTPGYPGFLALVKFLTGSFYPASVIQIFLSALTAFFIVKIGSLINRERVSIISALVFLFMPFSILASVQYITQSIFTTVIVGATYAFLKFAVSKRISWLIVSAILLPVAAYIRPIGGYIFVLFILALLAFSVIKKIKWQTVVYGSLLCTAAFFGILAPWMTRNYVEFGRYELSSITPPFLYFYEAPAVLKSSLGISFEEARKILIEKIESKTGIQSSDIAYTNFSEITDVVQKDAVASILSDPKAFLVTRFELTFSFFTRDGIRYFFEALKAPENYIEILAYRVPMIVERLVLFMFFAGFVAITASTLWKWRALAVENLLLITITLYFAGLTGSMASAGLRYPAEPFFLLLGTIGLFELCTLAASRIRNVQKQA